MKHFKKSKPDRLTIPFDDPGAFEDPDNIDDRNSVMYPEIDTPCEESPSGQCEYDALSNPERCKHCGRVT